MMKMRRKRERQLKQMGVVPDAHEITNGRPQIKRKVSSLTVLKSNVLIDFDLVTEMRIATTACSQSQQRRLWAIQRTGTHGGSSITRTKV